MDRTIMKRYTPPRVLQVAEILLERDFLDGSITMTVESVGQQVEEVDFSTGDFNFEWE